MTTEITFEGINAKWIQHIRLENGMTVAEYEQKLHEDLERGEEEDDVEPSD